MYYKDGYSMDENLRVIKCPRCGNEEFSSEAVYCRICGTMLFNYCQGEWNDYRQEWSWEHKNPGNARFCEICGKPTYFGMEKLLLDWEDVKVNSEEDAFPDFNEFDGDIFDETAAVDEDEEIPF
ncbi:hypothetical protein [Caminicella sporogenes]|uniref:hypothetical protein n=1 Tax=Caminicella sporogenes TaxID=166485 RepID=UPI00254165AB|nr:hypothetical protein [Caminicella sporogenes]WIF95096.1 hypothetical protein QNI18_00210 [Caminicella sporogenes]